MEIRRPSPGFLCLDSRNLAFISSGIRGINEKHVISSEQNLRLWDKARRVESPEDLVEFMNSWGQISRWLGDDGSKPYSEPYLLIEPHIDGLKWLASFVEAGDRIGFAMNLKGNRLLDCANLRIDTSQLVSPLVLDAPSLLRFMLIEMWNEFGGDRSAQLGLKLCRHCGRAFQIGGRRGMKARRLDAQFCSDSCKNLASRARVKSQKVRAPTPQR